MFSKNSNQWQFPHTMLPLYLIYRFLFTIRYWSRGYLWCNEKPYLSAHRWWRMNIRKSFNNLKAPIALSFSWINGWHENHENWLILCIFSYLFQNQFTCYFHVALKNEYMFVPLVVLQKSNVLNLKLKTIIKKSMLLISTK